MGESYVPTPIGVIRAKDLKFKVIKEDWNVYELEDGTVIRVKVVPVKISRGIDPETGDILYLKDRGEPFYSVRHTVVVAVEVPRELLREPELKKTGVGE